MFDRFFAHRRHRRCPRVAPSRSGQVSLSHMLAGQTGRVVEIGGGRGLVRRLSAMGIRPGSRITKVSSMFMRGPVTVRVGQTQLAVGFGMARKILVELD
jgi:ferrous iron transport protein A